MSDINSQPPSPDAPGPGQPHVPPPGGYGPAQGQPQQPAPYGQNQEQQGQPYPYVQAQPGQQPGQQPGYYGAPGTPPYTEQKSKIVAGILGILLGGLGVHRFYLGYVGIGIAQIVVTIVTLGFGSIWGLIEGIMILVGADPFKRDAKGIPLKDS